MRDPTYYRGDDITFSQEVMRIPESQKSAPGKTWPHGQE
jgi:hypothetical protein